MEEALLKFGPLGIAVLALAYAVIRLYNDNQKLHGRLEEFTKVVTDALSGCTSSQNQIGEVIQEFTNRLPRWIAEDKRRRD